MVPMSKNRDYMAQGLLVYIIANCLSKTSARISLIMYTIFIIFSCVNLIRSVKTKGPKVEKVALSSLIAFLMYALSFTYINEFYKQYAYIYETTLSWIIRILMALVTLIAFGLYGYSCVEVDNRAAWLGYLKMFSIICLAILIIIGLMYIIFP
jgi:hypothetical protein